jgi:probable HAF family extracellular repeat protein
MAPVFTVVLTLVGCSGGHTIAPQVLPVKTSLAITQTTQSIAQQRRALYQLIDLGTFGGPNSAVCVGGSPYCLPPQVLNDQGRIVGSADTSTASAFPGFCFDSFIPQVPPDCFTARAFEARNGIPTALNGFPNGSAIAIWISANGLIAGDAQNGQLDPSVSGFPELRAVLWNAGRMIDLGTLGGNESLANSVNTRGEVAGSSLNKVPDALSFIDGFLGIFFSVSNPTQTRAFLWHNGNMRDLGTLGGPDAFAFYVNERGQVAGYADVTSTPNADTGSPTIHPFLWQNGRMRDLGTLGGTQIFNIEGLNDRGEVIGDSLVAGDQHAHPFLWDGHRLIDLGAFGGTDGDGGALNNAGEVVGWGGTTQNCPVLEGSGQHPFLWKNGVKIDLGSVPGTDNGDAAWINNKEQVVGSSFSCDFSAADAFLWEKGRIVDLNAAVPASPLHLFLASDINDRGEIAAFGTLPNGDNHAVLLIPNGTDANASTTVRAAPSRKLTAAELRTIHAVLARRHFGMRRH